MSERKEGNRRADVVKQVCRSQAGMRGYFREILGTQDHNLRWNFQDCLLFCPTPSLKPKRSFTLLEDSFHADFL